jgi:subtilase family serine protease
LKAVRVLLLLLAVTAGFVFVSGSGAAAQGRRHVCDNPGAGAAGCHAIVVADTKGKPLASGAPSGFGPAQFHGGYNLPTAAPSLRTIAIVDAYDAPSITSDLATYNTQFGVPQLPTCSSPSQQAACFVKVDQRGVAGSYPKANPGWALEISLDVEVAHAICQTNCKIILVETDSNSFTNLAAGVDTAAALGANVISNSYGGGEFAQETTSAYDGHFDHPGVAITVSSGDAGFGVEYPAASRYVTAVGGTTLNLNGSGGWASEQVWSGAGSGCSAYETKPAWQTDSGCPRRTVADVSADADPASGAAVYDSTRYQGQRGWFLVGGTSLAAPLVAGVYALAGQGHTTSWACSHGGSLHDITSGSNGSCGGSYLCTGVAGFDGPTGLGSPNGVGGF